MIDMRAFANTVIESAITAQRLAAQSPTPEQIGAAARDAYLAECRAEGRESDPVMADETYWRAKRRAQGLPYYAGD